MQLSQLTFTTSVQTLSQRLKLSPPPAPITHTYFPCCFTVNVPAGPPRNPGLSQSTGCACSAVQKRYACDGRHGYGRVMWVTIVP